MQIYQILNKVTGKSYVGKSKDYSARFRRHQENAKRKINRRLYDSINFHGIENFELILLEDLGEVSKSFADEREKFWVENLNTLMPNGYNMTKGGDGGNTLESWTDEEKQKLWSEQGKKRTGKSRSESTKKLLSEIFKGRIISEEQRKKISDTLKQKYKSGEIKAVTPINYGQDHPGFIDVNIDEVLSLIKACKTLKYISETLGVSKHAIRSRLVEQTGKNFLEWRREYGIHGKLSAPRVD